MPGSETSDDSVDDTIALSSFRRKFTDRIVGWEPRPAGRTRDDLAELTRNRREIGLRAQGTSIRCLPDIRPLGFGFGFGFDVNKTLRHDM